MILGAILCRKDGAPLYTTTGRSGSIGPSTLSFLRIPQCLLGILRTEKYRFEIACSHGPSESTVVRSLSGPYLPYLAYHPYSYSLLF